MDSVDAVIDPHNEVRKLQELVKKLERQNEVLRNKQSGVPANNFSEVDPKELNGQIDYHGNDFVKSKLHDNWNSLADLEDVNFSQLSFEDDKWLYESTKRPSPEQSQENILSWIRQDLDHPSPEIKSSKRALIHSLDEAARMRHSSSSPVLGSQPTPSKSTGALSRSTEDNNIGCSRLSALRKNGIAPPGSSRLMFDSGTFTRPKKTAGSHGDGDSHQEVPNVPNAEDIENLAKQQEESLRQSVTPAKGTMKKHSYVDGDSARMSPSRFDVDGNYLGQHRGSLSSDHSTPPDSPHGNQHFQLNSSNDLRGRRNLQSAPGLQYRSHNSSDSSLERHSVDTNGSDEVNLAPEAMRAPSSRLQAPSYRSNASSLSKRSIPGMAPGLAQPLRGMAPQRQTGLPMAKRQIARPAQQVRSSLPMYSRRSNIPSPKPTSQPAEESWQDGCF